LQPIVASKADREAGHVGGIVQRTATWVPNTWPVQQTCDFLTVQRQTCVTLRGEVFAGYRYNTVGGEGFSEFVLDRGEIGTGLTWKPLQRVEGGVVLAVEAVRSAGPQSLIGIQGNSLVVRLLETYGNLAIHASPIDIGLRVGLVPERWIQQVEKGYDTRGLLALGSDDGRFFDRSDLGATLTLSGWKGLVELDLEYFNGEGRAQQELNAGKNTTVMATVSPLRRQTKKGPMTLSLRGGYRDGSLGVASLRNHRGAAAATFASPWAYAGFEYAHALGIDGQPGVVANTLAGWASGHVWAPWIGLMAKYDRTQQNLDDSASTVQRITAGVFSDLFPYIDRNRRRLRLYVSYQYEGYGEAAGPLPGTPEAANTHRVLLQLQGRGIVRIW
jgi:hypothetical protein